MAPENRTNRSKRLVTFPSRHKVKFPKEGGAEGGCFTGIIISAVERGTLPVIKETHQK